MTACQTAISELLIR